MDTFESASSSASSTPVQHSVPFRVVLPHTDGHVSVGFGTTLRSHSSEQSAQNALVCWAIDDVAIAVLH